MFSGKYVGLSGVTTEGSGDNRLRAPARRRLSPLLSVGGASPEGAPARRGRQVKVFLRSAEMTLTEQGQSIATTDPTSDEHADVKFPLTTDIANFEAKTLPVFDKQFIVSAGLLQPKGPFPKKIDGANKGRSFSEYFYKRYTKSGLSLQRIWLSYGSLADKCYCIPCWLVSIKPNEA